MWECQWGVHIYDIPKIFNNFPISKYTLSQNQKIKREGKYTLYIVVRVHFSSKPDTKQSPKKRSNTAKLQSKSS